MTTKKTTTPEEQPVAANAGPTVAVTDPKTGETEAVEPGTGKKATPAEGGAARIATMEPAPRNADTGQVATTSGSKA